MGRPRKSDSKIADAVTELTPAWLRRNPLPEASPSGDKESRGRVFIVGGSPETPGAVTLASESSLRAGAGKLQLATVASIAPTLGLLIPEAKVIALAQKSSGALRASNLRILKKEAAEADSVLIGPGMQGDADLVPLITKFLKFHQGSKSSPDAQSTSYVLDAAALKIFRARTVLTDPHRIIVTPHAGEMASMMEVEKSEIVKTPLRHAQLFAKQFGTVTVLKGATTYIVDPRGPVLRNVRGNGGLATSGSGDCLAGIIAGLAARGTDPFAAAAWGVFLHACAGEVLAKKIGSTGYLARELPIEIPKLMQTLAK